MYKETENDLNSVIIEGSIDKIYENYKSDVECKISVSSNHFNKIEKGFEKETVSIDTIIPLFKKLFCKYGQEVRVTGRLRQDKKMRHYIQSEHIEFRPEPKKKKGKKYESLNLEFTPPMEEKK